jgi:eukaryotic-like serine/threonine-protein kinase
MESSKGSDPNMDRTMASMAWRAGSRLGSYRILENLGEGGMGVVYLAEQVEPIRRKVALKVVKLGIDFKQIVARFESERQALAMMDHPGIAGIYDAGVTPEGIPYFVMEYVSGTTITKHCEQHGLGIRERLELFIQVCEAVQHAHHKAIIHRDLKPSNIMITVQDGRAFPKIIDFGVAKTLAQPLTDKTLHTGIGQFIGTPSYMSPEQADMARQDVDTRTDIYSLGGLLYELLSGSPPVDFSTKRGVGFEELLRIIREEDPPKPSRRVRLTARAMELPGHRRAEIQQLEKQLKGDLDWITMKALDKDRNRRYSSPSELVDDIRRFLSDRPVTARPPNFSYRSRKFVRRHRVAVAAMASVLTLLIVFGFLMVLQAQRVMEERNRANREAEAAKQVAAFLTDLFKVSDPKIAQGHQPTVREILDEGAGKIQTALADQPLVQTRLQRTMAEAYENLGLYAQAEKLYRTAFEKLTAVVGENDIEAIETLGNLSNALWRQGRMQEAEEILTRTFEAKRRLLGDEDLSTLRTMNSLATVHMLQGRYREAEDLYAKGLEIRRRIQGEDHTDTLGAANNLANLYARQDRMDEAEELYLFTLQGRKKFQGENHPDAMGAVSNLADHYSFRGRFEEAEKLHLEVLERRKKVLGDLHPDTLSSLTSLGDHYRNTGNLAAAQTFTLDALEGRKATLGENHPDTLLTCYNLGKLRTDQGHYKDAETLLLKAARGWTKLFGPGHPNVLRAQSALARLNYHQRRYREAEILFAEILSHYRKWGDRPNSVIDTLFNLACVNALQADATQALAHLGEAVELGFSDIEALNDKDLDSLRNNGQFKELLARVRAQVENGDD